MQVHVTDTQVVGDVSSVLWSTIQQGSTVMQMFIKNSGVNTINYSVQQYNGTSWVDMDVLGTDLHNTLSPSQIKAITINSAYPQVQMIGNASGGALLDFSANRYFNRASGGALPLLSL